MKKLLYVLSLLIIATMVLTACGGAAAPAATEVPAQQATKAPVQATEVAAEQPADANALPREETLYFNGQQWSAVVGWNPYSNSNNNAMAIAQQDNARVIMFETPHLSNMRSEER